PIITKGGVTPNIIPGESRLEIYVRAATNSELTDLTSRVTECIMSGASAARCSASIRKDEKHCYENLITNKVMGDVFDTYAQRLGIHPTDFGTSVIPAGSTDMGNVSHVVPSIHPFYKIHDEAINHSKGFTDASGHPRAQEPTLAVAKSLAMTALKLMRCPKTLEDVKKQFKKDLDQGL
ncbi:peptidase M20 domain-containing protein 2, partial [Caerostris extrusa]